MEKEKICRIGIFVLVLIILATLGYMALVCGSSRLDLSTALFVGSTMIGGFFLLLAGCHSAGNEKKKNFSN